MSMTEAGGPPTTPETSSHSPGSGHAVASALGTWIRNWASQDWIVITYLSLLITALCVGKGPHRGECIVHVAADMGGFLFVLALVRGQVLRWGSLTSALVYRLALIATLLASFFQLREILPAVSPWAVDASIYAFDLRVFGFEASVALDQFVTPASTEWFAFFYFLYFLILSVHVLPMTFWSKDPQLLNRFATGMLLMFMAAHIIYMMVPGYGPYWFLKDTFKHELQGGTFWRLVRETVDAGGAQKDIFPSLHTAAPTFFAIFSFRHRTRMPFKYSWPVMAFVAVQVIIATMFLRWHYLIDIVAGLVLALTAQGIGQYVADWETSKRQRLGQQPVWMPLAYPWPRS